MLRFGFLDNLPTSSRVAGTHAADCPRPAATREAR
jgi:hypothetical protein